MSNTAPGTYQQLTATPAGRSYCLPQTIWDETLSRSPAISPREQLPAQKQCRKVSGAGLNHAVVSDSTMYSVGEEREGSGLYCPIRSTNCFPALKTSSLQHFSTGCVHSVALCKPQPDLRQHGLTPLPGHPAAQALSHGPLHLILWFPTSADNLQLPMVLGRAKQGDHCLAAGPQTLHWLLGMWHTRPNAGSACWGLCSQRFPREHRKRLIWIQQLFLIYRKGCRKTG